MKLFHKKNTFLLDCQFEEREIPKRFGFSFDYDSKLWHTKDPFKAIKLRNYADDDLEAKFKQFISYVNKRLSKSESTNSDIDVPKPDNGMEYYNFQKAGIEYLYNNDNVLLGDEQGTGKTIQVIGCLNMIEDLERALIICPNTLKSNWKNEMNDWLVHDLPIRVCDTKNFRMEKGISIINYEAFRNNTTRGSDNYTEPRKGGKYNNTELILREIKRNKDVDVLALDESHRIKNWSSNTTRNIFKAKKWCKKKILMTGSPMLNRPEELWTSIKFLGYKDKFGGTKKYFGYRYCDLKRTHWGWDYSGSSNLKELQIKLRSNFMIRRTRQQVLKELPDKNRKPVMIEISDSYKKHLKEYNKVLKDVSRLSVNGSDNMESNILSGINVGDISKIAEVRQIVGQAKIQPVYNYTKEILENDEKVVLFAYHTNVLNAYLRKFKDYNPAFIDGSVKEGDRQDEVDRFTNDDSCRIIILQLDVGSVGLNLQVSHNVVFGELGYVPQIMNQAEDRCNRIGSTNPSTNHYMLADGTLDATIGKKIIKKQEIFDKVIESKSI